MFLEHFISIFFCAVVKEVVDRGQKNCSKGHVLIFFRKVYNDVYNHNDCHGEAAVPPKFVSFLTKTKFGILLIKTTG